jgi:hypothetical protein
MTEYGLEPAAKLQNINAHGNNPQKITPLPRKIAQMHILKHLNKDKGFL